MSGETGRKPFHLISLPVLSFVVKESQKCQARSKMSVVTRSVTSSSSSECDKGGKKGEVERWERKGGREQRRKEEMSGGR